LLSNFLAKTAIEISTREKAWSDHGGTKTAQFIKQRGSSANYRENKIWSRGISAATDSFSDAGARELSSLSAAEGIPSLRLLFEIPRRQRRDMPPSSDTSIQVPMLSQNGKSPSPVRSAIPIDPQ
jgi:hypothetical protein